MKSLDRHILKNILLPALLAFGVIAFLGVAAKLRSKLDEIPEGFLTLYDFFWLYIYMLPSLIALLVPVSFLFGILMAFGRMAQQGEITAMQASGISLKRMSLPVLLAGIFLAGLSFFAQDYLQPWGIRHAFHVIYTELPERATIDKLDAGELHDIDGYRIYFEDKDSETHTLYNFDLILPNSNGEGIDLYHADEAQLLRTGDQYTLELFRVYYISSNNYMDGKKISRAFPPPPTVSKDSIRRYGSNIQDLLKIERELSQSQEATSQNNHSSEIHQFRGELAKRFSIPFAAIAIALIGAPLGVQARQRGKSSLFSMGFGVMVLYYTLLTVAEPTSMSDLHEYILRAWIPNLVLMGLGVAMLWKVDRV